MNTILKTETFDITPDQSLMPKLGQSGYSISEAISELVDNSIDARTEGEKLTINVHLSTEEIKISDNGCGMEKDGAKKSLILGLSQKKEGELGQFGLGMKTACTSLGKYFEVATKPRGTKEQYLITYNEDDFLKDKGWKSALHVMAAPAKESGTSVLVKDLRFKYYKGLDKRLSDDLVDRFAPFIFNSEVDIVLNGKKLRSAEPELIKDSRQEFEIELFNGKKVYGWLGILKKGSQAKSGFNLYRNNRLIRAHEKLGYQYHPSKMWITGEVHLNPIPVTHNKREFITTDEQYVDFLAKFSELIKPLLAKIKQRQNEEKVNDIAEEERETLKDNLLKAINMVDDFKELSGNFGDKPNKRSEDDGDLFNKERRSPIENRVTEVVEEPKAVDETPKRGRKPKRVQRKMARFITIAGNKFRFDYKWGELDEDIAKVSEIDKEKGLIVVTLNYNFPLISIVKDKYTYIALMVIEGIVEAFLRENNKGLEKLTELRDRTVKQFGKIVTEDIEATEYKEMESMNKLRMILEGSLDIPESLPVNQREREILYMRYGIGREAKNLQEIGSAYKLTRERVRQIINNSSETILKLVE